MIRNNFFTHQAQTSNTPLGIEIISANGVFLLDTQGKSYLDLISGISVSNVGHGHPKIKEAIHDQLNKHSFVMVYGELIQSSPALLAKKLTSLLPSSLNNVYFTNSGTEACEGALKLAKRYTGRYKTISFRNAYHGSTMGALSICGDENFKQSFRPLIPGANIFDFNSDEAIQAIDDTVAAVITEVVQAESGVNLPANNFHKRLREKCNQTGTLLIFDEIQTGMGRTGKMFAFEHYNVVPDILLLGKGFGGGMPLAAFISNKKVMDAFTHDPVLGHITTFGGHPVCCAASLATFEILEEDKLIDDVSRKENIFVEKLKHEKIKSLRHCGLLMSIEFDSYETCKKTIDKAIEYGVLTDWFLFAPHCLRIAPPLTISDEQISHACEVLLKAMNEA